MEAFSDGVFAIAITLLVLEIKLEPGAFEHLWSSLAREWPAYLAYVTSFLTVGAVWMAHHSLFTHLRFVDPTLMRLNVVLLMVAAFLPFPTGVLAEALHESRSAERAAVVVYGITALAIELLLAAAWRYAAARPALAHERIAAAPARRRGAVGSVLYAVAIIIGALLLPKIATAGYLLVAMRGVFFTGGEGRLTLTGR